MESSSSYIDAVIGKVKYGPGEVDRVAHRKVPAELAIVEYDPSWPAKFEVLKSRISDALGATAVSIKHYGSTSVPGLPAKDVIDIDLAVKDILDEDSYVPQLEAAGFHFLFREKHWHDHRFFVAYEPLANLHIFAVGAAEFERHKIFHDWLVDHEEDRVRYAQAKRDAAAATNAVGGDVMDYNQRKNDVIKDILQKAFKQLGYIQ